jgi:hypothetical protein
MERRGGTGESHDENTENRNDDDLAGDELVVLGELLLQE